MRLMTVDSLTALKRRIGDVSLPLPDGMRTPLGCDAVGMPEAFGRQVMARLPKIGCVYADGPVWWLIVPSGSEFCMDWPTPVRYATGAVVPGGQSGPRLIHRPGGTAPYTPPIPLYLTLCRLTGTVPAWMRHAPHPRRSAER
ncbi:hypothetical protein DSC45_11065 [Streptomyces sp. YIM 130001]|nr:hypothetical protein DSC45_11065 [Streptomyces sp. YIM 130001]